jgi:hypothetical protein
MQAPSPHRKSVLHLMGSINSASSATIMNDVLSSATISAHSMSLSPSDLSVRSNTDGSTTSKETMSSASDTDSSRKFSDSDSDLESEDKLQPVLRNRTGAGDDMSWADIDDILVKAEKRLREQQALLRTITAESKEEPTLQTSSLPAPYTSSSDRLPRPDCSALVSTEMRLLAEKPRVIEDKFFTKSVLKKQKKGMTRCLFSIRLCMMKSYPKSSRRGYWAHFEFHSAYLRVYHIIVTLIIVDFPIETAPPF